MAQLIAKLVTRLRRPRLPLDARVAEASHRIRAKLDTEYALRTTAEEAHRALGLDGASAWVPGGQSPPREVHRLGEILGDSTRAVTRAAQRGRLVRQRLATSSDGAKVSLAVPLSAPSSGVLGVLYLEADDWTEDRENFIAGLAREAGFALETTRLYEKALAAKEKSEAILTQIGEGIVVTDAHGSIIECNQAAESVIGNACARSRGRTCEEILGLSLGERELDCSEGCALLREPPSPTSLVGHEVWRTRADGRRQPLLVNVAPVNDGDGNVAEVVHALRDITRLKEADEAKTLFLATASHELKTPLTVIQGFSQLLNDAKESSDAERKVALEAMESRAKQLNKIVDRLLLSSRIEAGRAKVKPEPIDIGPLLIERCESLAASLKREISTELDENLPLTRADRDAVVTVVDHLLDNAVKYSPDGGRIRVTATSDDRRVWVTVIDGGIGMTPLEAEQCFDKFWQAESSDVRRFGGTGIGLYIVRSLVEAMGGDVAVASVQGEGSAFTFSLKREDATWEPGTSAVIGAPRPGVGDTSMVREFMRQLGVPGRKVR